MNGSIARRALRFAGVTGVALAATVATALPAHAINRVDCGERSDFLYFEVDGVNPCFANAGTIDVAIYGVGWMNTGNNEVSFTYRTVLGGPQWDSGRLPKWYAFDLGLASGSPSGKVHKIERITIY
ncbi:MULTISPECIES: beta/gamma crystallin domain-containing protein [Streptomyces]|uniref:beta/gamma crystallin domain-containing protein n=1 Tax=Streptomyces TaxID=1883 RepID=UPI000BC53DFE|nr:MULTISPECIES: beta/gamma crystallin domain-containing protein [Streptomyces]MDX2555897.1 beta/gamma crystallin domain-containing protein [Streptomyces stelliscabiei]MDX2616502.1 beta/gamma crystallin domain-containing protein [Streptomyces stelliscabiei]MDX2641224.1 beta/gamma crystallin domain-containing protein [Streptomyces stelliscabiei]MDX2665938.1 beta/gamma crystallin domain-containing protein [Streptomyces stelliscabiei]MDX2716417.1 beta/gamma crystallin domain-containing protein [S